MIRKLVTAIMALVLTAVLAVTVSYAWMTISSNPVAEGIQISIGGGTTILIAADVMETVDGEVYHYPGTFGQTLNFKQYDRYDYLNELSALSPVSTADGFHWFLPEYYDYNDIEVINGEAQVGQAKPIGSFFVDQTLAFANLSNEQAEKAQSGHYIYVDFWVVSPHSDYTLRIARGDETGGSFVIELMNPVEGTDGSYTLSATSANTAAYARLGFLVNEDVILDDSILHYRSSSSQTGPYTKLKGVYHDPEDDAWYDSGRFTIYEPNADWHTGDANGSYIVTQPVTYGQGGALYADISQNLTVQLTNRWKNTDSSDFAIARMFTVWMTGKNLANKTPEEIQNAFYRDYLQGQVSSYVKQGNFMANTAALYEKGNTVSSEQLSSLTQAGATSDVYMTVLEKNVPQRIRMFIWLEGQDIDCTGSANASNLAISIELAGSNQ